MHLTIFFKDFVFPLRPQNFLEKIPRKKRPNGVRVIRHYSRTILLCPSLDVCATPCGPCHSVMLACSVSGVCLPETSSRVYWSCFACHSHETIGDAFLSRQQSAGSAQRRGSPLTVGLPHIFCHTSYRNLASFASFPASCHCTFRAGRVYAEELDAGP